MSQITDTFTGLSGTTLISHTSDSGNASGGKSVGGAGNIRTHRDGVCRKRRRLRGKRLQLDAGPRRITMCRAAFRSCQPPAGPVCRPALRGRRRCVAFTGYLVTYDGSPRLVLYQCGNGTPLGTYRVCPGIAAGQTHTLKLSMRGNTITVYWDGTAVITYTASGETIVADRTGRRLYAEFGRVCQPGEFCGIRSSGRPGGRDGHGGLHHQLDGHDRLDGGQRGARPRSRRKCSSRHTGPVPGRT